MYLTVQMFWPCMKEGDMMQTNVSHGLTKKEIEFVVFCIENVASALKVDGKAVYDAWTKGSDILYGYVVPFYDVLHTQGKEYIVQDLLTLMKEKGVSA